MIVIILNTKEEYMKNIPISIEKVKNRAKVLSALVIISGVIMAIASIVIMLEDISAGIVVLVASIVSMFIGLITPWSLLDLACCVEKLDAEINSSAAYCSIKEYQSQNTTPDNKVIKDLLTWVMQELSTLKPNLQDYVEKRSKGITQILNGAVAYEIAVEKDLVGEQNDIYSQLLARYTSQYNRESSNDLKMALRCIVYEICK